MKSIVKQVPYFLIFVVSMFCKPVVSKQSQKAASDAAGDEIYFGCNVEGDRTQKQCQTIAIDVYNGKAGTFLDENGSPKPGFSCGVTNQRVDQRFGVYNVYLKTQNCVNASQDPNTMEMNCTLAGDGFKKLLTQIPDCRGISSCGSIFVCAKL